MYRLIDVDLNGVVEELPYRPEKHEVLTIEFMEVEVVAYAGNNVFVKRVLPKI